MRSSSGNTFLLATLALLFVYAGLTANAQGLAPIFRGDHGLKSGSQPPPGIYVTNLTLFYDSDTIKSTDGSSTHRVNLAQGINATAVTFVSKKKFLGGHYSFTAAPAIANVAIDTPFAGSETGIGMSDSYVQPFQLGWEKKRADFVVGYGFYAPTGRFTPGASNNTGLGMWSHEFSAGTTVYLDKKKEWHAATAGFYNFQSKVRDTTRKVGNLVSLEGGVGRSFNHYLSNVGVAYFAQWKVTRDTSITLPNGFQNKDRYYGVGPEINTVIPINKTTMTSFGIRYLQEVGNRVATQGSLFYMSFTIVRPAH
ncbi:MAG: transporter [Pyrinomonadaceae bacterium]|nr:transporter [Pyrinomonadaceae bacterium]